MQKLIVVPIDSNLDLDHFNKSVQATIAIRELKPLLFVSLYQKIAESHEAGDLRIWGVPRGTKSSTANKWNQISEGDVCVFLADGSLIGYARVQIKFQSESIASQIWPGEGEFSKKQYLFTLGNLMSIDSVLTPGSLKLWKKAKFEVSNFEVLENTKSAEFISSLPFPPESVPVVNDSQAFGLSSAEKKAIELHAVDTAIKFLKDKGYSEIQDVGSIHSYDLYARGPEGRLHVEVKGTTGKGEKVILTRNEVAFQKSCFPENALVIVSDIEISFEGELSTSGGKVEFISPWEIEDSNLAPISFEYSV
jgi:hypothetical protein